MVDILSSLPEYNTFRHLTDGNIKSYSSKANNGDSEAQLILGMCYMYGQVKDVNLEEAFKWFEKSSAKGNQLALFFLGNLYENGYGVPKNFAKAIEYYSKLFDAAYVKEQTVSKNITINNTTELLKLTNELILNIYCIIGERQKSINWKDVDQKLKNVLLELSEILLLYQKDKNGRYKTIYDYFIFQILWSNVKVRFSALLARHCFIETILYKGFYCDKSLYFESLLSYFDSMAFTHSIEFALSIATQSNSPHWQNLSALLLWRPGQYEKCIDLFTKAKSSGLKVADECLKAYINDKCYLLASNGHFGTAADRYKLAKENQPTETFHRDSIDYNYWLLKAATLGNVHAIHEISEVKDFKVRLLDESWQTCADSISLTYLELEEDANECAKKQALWKPAMLNEIKKIKSEDEALRIAKEQAEIRTKREGELRAEQSKRDKERARLAKEQAELKARQDAEAKAEQERIAKERAELKAQKELEQRKKEEREERNKLFGCLVIFVAFFGWFFFKSCGHHYDFKEGFIKSTYLDEGNNEKVGIDRHVGHTEQGEIFHEIIAPQYDDIESCGDYAFFKVLLNDKVGLLDTLGHEILPPVYDKIDDFENGQTTVYKDNKSTVMTKIECDDPFNPVKLK